MVNTSVAIGSTLLSSQYAYFLKKSLEVTRGKHEYLKSEVCRIQLSEFQNSIVMSFAVKILCNMCNVLLDSHIKHDFLVVSLFGTVNIPKMICMNCRSYFWGGCATYLGRLETFLKERGTGFTQASGEVLW